jgi:hypothetical protein
MDAEIDRRFIYTRQSAPHREFVVFWASRYYDPREDRYARNIRGPHTEETLRELFRWKIGDRFFKHKWRALSANFISKMERAAHLPPDISPEDFLQKEFPIGGGVYRIFWLHCWYPARFPIYDQHVHRAMTYISDGKLDELERYSEQKVIALYLDHYVPFHEPFAKVEVPFDPKLDGVRGRKADRALFTFGQCLLTQSLPSLRS